MAILYNCCTMHNSTHSVHNRLLKVWLARLPRPWPFCYVFSPPLSEANCQPFPPPGGPGPPASNMAPFSPGSTHIPSLLSVTHRTRWYQRSKVDVVFGYSLNCGSFAHSPLLHYTYLSCTVLRGEASYGGWGDLLLIPTQNCLEFSLETGAGRGKVARTEIFKVQRCTR